MTRTTHFKMGDIKHHRGFNSEDATIEYYPSRHGDVLTVLGIMDDPAMFAEPFALTSPFRLENLALVPHYRPGKNPFKLKNTGVEKDSQ